MSKKSRTTIGFHIIAAGAALAMVFVYVWQTNTQAVSSFAMRSLAQDKRALEREVDELQWQVSNKQALASLAARAETMDFGRPQNVSFVKIGLSTVAVAEE